MSKVNHPLTRFSKMFRVFKKNFHKNLGVQVPHNFNVNV